MGDEYKMNEFFSQLLETYAMFFNWEMWIEVLSDPVSWGLIGTLVLMEGLLSSDNALVLAVMVKDLPEKQRKKALFYGLIGAYLFRFLAIGVGVYLIEILWVKLIGGGYLAWLSIQYFYKKYKHFETTPEVPNVKKSGLLIRLFGTFWGTVVSVELMDIAFSVDSILAAFGVSQEIWVLFVGGILGVLMMRGVAGIFLRLIDKIPELESAAYLLIAFIAVKMVGSNYGLHIDHTMFFMIIIVIFGATILLHFYKKKKNQQTLNM
jgi:YkoY family integral membrane protein